MCEGNTYLFRRSEGAFTPHVDVEETKDPCNDKQKTGKEKEEKKYTLRETDKRLSRKAKSATGKLFILDIFNRIKFSFCVH